MTTPNENFGLTDAQIAELQHQLSQIPQTRTNLKRLERVGQDVSELLRQLDESESNIRKLLAEFS